MSMTIYLRMSQISLTSKTSKSWKNEKNPAGDGKKKPEMKGEIVELIKGLNKIINPINPTKN